MSRLNPSLPASVLLPVASDVLALGYPARKLVGGVPPESCCKLEEARTRLHVAILVDNEDSQHPALLPVLRFGDLAKHLVEERVVVIGAD